MEKELTKLIKRMRNVEDAFKIILKIEMFSDLTGDCFYLTDSLTEDWKYAFSFSDFENFVQELDMFESKLTKE